MKFRGSNVRGIRIRRDLAEQRKGEEYGGDQVGHNGVVLNLSMVK